MMCEKCHEKVASVRVTRIVNGIRSGQNLCAECAGINMEDMMFYLSENKGNNFYNKEKVVGEVKKSEGNIFSSESILNLSFPKINNEIKNTIDEKTKKSIVTDKKEELKAKLSDAVSKEEFEKAAQIRDEIYFLEKEEQNGYKAV